MKDACEIEKTPKNSLLSQMPFIILIVPNFVTFTNIFNATQITTCINFRNIRFHRNTVMKRPIFQFCLSLMKNKIRTITMFASSPR